VTPSGVLVFRIGQLGDTIVSMPAIAAIREGHPHVPLVLLTDRHPEGRGFTSSWDVLGSLGWFDEVIYYSAGRDSIWKRACIMLQTAYRLRRSHIGLVYDLSPFRSAQQLRRDSFFFLKISGIPEIRRPRPCCPPPHGQNDCLTPVEPEWSRLLSVVSDPPTKRFTFSIPDAARQEAIEALEMTKIEEATRMIAIAPGSKMPSKRWPRERFEEIIAKLVKQDPDLRMVLIGGPGDIELCEKISSVDPARLKNLAGRLSVLGTAAILEKCLAYLGNDTGAMHLAAMLGKPCIALFSARDYPGKWTPYGEGHIALRRDIDCSGCMLEECRDRGNECLLKISSEEVLDSLHTIIGGDR